MNVKSTLLKARIMSEGEIILPLQGKCMSPLLMSGDKAKIIPITNYSKGKLYLFELIDGNLAVHRLIDKNDSCLTMKGDRSRGFEYIPYQNILGEVSEIKLLDHNSWISMQQNSLINIIILYLSKKLAKDKNIKNEPKVDFILNKVYSKMLILFSYCIRSYWQ